MGQVTPELIEGHGERRLMSTLTHFDCLCFPSSSTPGLLMLAKHIPVLPLLCLTEVGSTREAWNSVRLPRPSMSPCVWL